MGPALKFSDKEFGQCEIVYVDKDISLAKKLCFFASHTYCPRLPEYVFSWLESIREAAVDIVFISTSNIDIRDVTRLSRLTACVIIRENKGTDFGSWCAAIRYFKEIVEPDFLYLCNDSVFGPFVPFSDLHRKFRDSPEEVMGITDSYQGVAYHIQSYFVGIKRSVLERSEWIDFWEELSLYVERQKIIEEYEIGFSIMLKRAGFNFLIFSDWSKKFTFPEILNKICQSPSLRSRWLNRALHYRDRFLLDINPCAFFWNDLIERSGFPFLKRELLIYPNLYEEFELGSIWEQKLDYFPNSRVGQIKLFLVDYFLHRALPLIFPGAEKLRFAFSGSEESRKGLITRLKNRDRIEFVSMIRSLGSVDSDTVSDAEYDIGLEQMGVKVLPGTAFWNKAEKRDFVFVHISSAILGVSNAEMFHIRVCLKRIVLPIIIAENEAVLAFLASALHLRETGVLLEREVLYPISLEKKKAVFDLLFDTSREVAVSPFHRPNLAAIVRDAREESNRTGFLSLSSNKIQIDAVFSTMPANWTDQGERYKLLQQRYSEIYEATPIWYKLIGHFIKLIMGKKRLKFQFYDKGSKSVYSQTVEDLSLWYNLQYEVLPSWYKKFGRWLLKGKSNV